MPLADYLPRLADGKFLSKDDMRDAMADLMSGSPSEAQAAAFLTALRLRGETIDELQGAAEVMRENVRPLGARIEGLLDTCGTGGDHSGTFNISTAVALVVAASGVPVAKHGNRSVTSPCGSSEVLQHLGVNLEQTADEIVECLRSVGFGYFHAPLWHPAMKHVAPVRGQLGFKTMFNYLGPLSNPAGADYQLLGVGQPEWGAKLAQVLLRLGVKAATVVTGSDGLDEVTLAGETLVIHLHDGSLDERVWTPESFGLPGSEVSDWQASGPEQSADVLTQIFSGVKGPCRDVVLANAAAALWTVGYVDMLKEGVNVAARAIDQGAVTEKLRELTAATQGSGA